MPTLDRSTAGSLLPCPCCDYLTLSARGVFEICPVCFWEDDGVDLDRPDFESGANRGLCLRSARANFERIGACDPAMLEHVLAPRERSCYRRLERKPGA